MKIACLLILWLIPMNIMCQLTLPKPVDVKRIVVSKTSMANWYQPDELLKLLPQFVATDGTYGTKAIPFQYGKFILKNGKEITWMANYTDSILLYDGSNEQLFKLPKQNSAMFPIWDNNGKEGFIDENGNVVIKPQFDKVREFSEGFAPVMIGNKWGYINEKGEIVIAPRWLTVGQFNEGIAAITEQERWDVRNDSNYYTYNCGYINTNGDYVIQPKFRQSCDTFSDGLAQIKIDWDGEEDEKRGWFGFKDKQDNWVIKPQFYKAGNFSNGFALVSEATGAMWDSPKSLYLIDKTGRKVADKKDCAWQYNFHEGLLFIYPDRFINEQCEEVFKFAPNITKTTDYIYFSEGLLAVSSEINGEKRFGYLDRTGKVAIDFKFSRAEPFADGLAAVGIKENGKETNAYINQKGEIVLKNKRGNTLFKNGLSFNFLHLWTISERPNARNIYGYMNKQGKYVWLSPRAEIYLDKQWIKENYIGVK